MDIVLDRLTSSTFFRETLFTFADGTPLAVKNFLASLRVKVTPILSCIFIRFFLKFTSDSLNLTIHDDRLTDRKHCNIIVTILILDRESV